MKRLTTISIFVICVVIGLAGFVKVAPGGKYFEHNGKVLIPLGFNDAITWPSLLPLSYGNKAGGEEYFEKLASYGVNTLRIMIEYAQDRSGISLLESPLGNYNQSVIAIWDEIIRLAERYDIYLIVTPWDPFWMYENWDVNPYNAANGGPLKTMSEFLTNDDVRRYQKDRFRFMVERYGHSEQILAWELNNEIELWYGKTFYKADYTVGNEAREWIKEMSEFIRDIEMDLYGQSHLITVSTASPGLTGLLAGKLYRFDYMDFFTTHFYFDTIKRPSNTLAIANDVISNINYHNYLFGDSIPFMDTESGPIDRWPQPAKFDAECYRVFSWAHFTSGGTGIGMRWPYTIPHLMPDYLLEVLIPISQFIESGNIDWLSFKGVNLDMDIHLDSESKAVHTCSGNNYDNLTEIIGWAVSDKPFGRASLYLQGLAPGSYVIEIWQDIPEQSVDFYLVRQRTFDFNGELAIDLEVEHSSFAYKIYRKVD
jgi:mannan endo-1,4-beta-mannosidase